MGYENFFYNEDYYKRHNLPLPGTKREETKKEVNGTKKEQLDRFEYYVSGFNLTPKQKIETKKRFTEWEDTENEEMSFAYFWLIFIKKEIMK